MDQMLISVICLILASGLYLVCGLKIVRTLNRPESQVGIGWRWLAAAGFFCHAGAICAEMFSAEVVHFGFALAVSGAMCLAVGIMLVESLVHRMTGLMGIVLLLAAVAVVLPGSFVGEAIPSERWTVLFRIHLLMALAAYSFMIIAVIQATLLMLFDRQMKNPLADQNQVSLLSNMPSLLAMERILFRIIGCGFVCLTAVLVLGALTTFETYGQIMTFDHKTVLTWLSWAVFAVLLVGRCFFGWRNKRALFWFWLGIGFLATAYVVYHFILEIFLS